MLNHITGLIDLGVDVKVLHTRSGAPHETPPDFIKYRIHDRTIKILPDEREEQFMRSLARGAETSANRIDSIPAALIEEGSSVATVLREGRSELMQMRERMLDLYAAQQIAAIDPATDSEEGFNEWGEADCFGQAQAVARTALSTVGSAGHAAASTQKPNSPPAVTEPGHE